MMMVMMFGGHGDRRCLGLWEKGDVIWEIPVLR